MANQTRQLAELLQGEGVKVTLVQVNAPYKPRWIKKLRGIRAFFRLVPYIVRLWRAAAAVDIFHVMANSGWSWHLIAAPAVWIARMRGIPALVNYRGGEAEGFLARSGPIVLKTLRCASALAVPSGFLQGVFRRRGIPSDIVPNIVDLERFRPTMRSRDPRAPHLVVARNLEPIYDVQTALHAFALIRGEWPQARLSIAGSGPQLKVLTDLTAELGLSEVVNFCGSLDRDRMAELYRSASAVVNPSLVDNMPNSVLEAMASGVPVVSTNVGGVPFIVQDGVTALLVAPGKPADMAQALRRVLRDAELAEGLRNAALTEVQKYTWCQVRQRWEKLYASALTAVPSYPSGARDPAFVRLGRSIEAQTRPHRGSPADLASDAAGMLPIRSARHDPLLQLLLQLPGTRRLSVLGFHRVMAEFDPLRPGELTAADFEARMRWIAANFIVMSLTSAVRALERDRLPKRALCITFDDGYADNHDLALPILRRLGLPATFFVASGYLDGGCMFNDAVIEAVRQARGPELDLEALQLGRHSLRTLDARRLAIARILVQLKYFEQRRREDVTRGIVERAGGVLPANLMMSSEQVATLHRAGMEIGAHTVTHPILAQIELAAARDEMALSRARLEEIIGARVCVFAYPNGKPLHDYRREHVALARGLGFEAAVSTAWGAARAGDDVFQIPRFTPWDRADWRFGLRLANNLFARRHACA